MKKLLTMAAVLLAFFGCQESGSLQSSTQEGSLSIQLAPANESLQKTQAISISQVVVELDGPIATEQTIDPSVTSSVVFDALPAGTYVLTVKALNADSLVTHEASKSVVVNSGEITYESINLDPNYTTIEAGFSDVPAEVTVLELLVDGVVVDSAVVDSNGEALLTYDYLPVVVENHIQIKAYNAEGELLYVGNAEGVVVESGVSRLLDIVLVKIAGPGALQLTGTISINGKLVINSTFSEEPISSSSSEDPISSSSEDPISSSSEDPISSSSEDPISSSSSEDPISSSSEEVPAHDYIVDNGDGSLTFSVTFPSAVNGVQVFIRQNGIHNISEFITGSGVANGDGSYTYSYTGAGYQDGDVVDCRFYFFPSIGGTHFVPGPIENVWSEEFVVGAEVENPISSSSSEDPISSSSSEDPISSSSSEDPISSSSSEDPISSSSQEVVEHDYITRNTDGSLTFTIVLPTQMNFVEVFVTNGGLQIHAGAITDSGVANSDGTYTYTYTRTGFVAGNEITTRFHFTPAINETHFEPGPGPGVWSEVFVY